MTGCSDISYNLGLGLCPINIEGCCVLGITIVGTCSILFNFACDRCVYCHVVCRIISAYTCCCTALAIICKVVYYAPCVTGCSDISYNLGLGLCPINIEGCCVLGITIVGTCSILFNFACDRCVYCHVVCRIISAYTCCSASRAILCKIIFYAPCVVLCGNIYNVLSLGGCPINTKGCCISCYSLFRTSGRLSLLECYICCCSLYVCCIISAYTCCCTALAILCKCIGYFIPIVVDSRNILLFLSLSCCPIRLKICSVGSPAIYGTACRSLNCTTCCYGFGQSTLRAICTGTSCGAFPLTFNLCPRVTYAPAMIGCRNVLLFLSLSCCPIRLKICSVGSPAIYGTACRSLNCTTCCYGFGQSTLRAICTGTSCGAFPLTFNLCPRVTYAPAMIGCGNISLNCFGLGLCPINIEGCCVLGITIVGTCSILFNFACDRCVYCHVVCRIISAYTCCCTALAIICKVVRYVPCVTGCGNIFCISVTTSRTCESLNTLLGTGRSRCYFSYVRVSKCCAFGGTACGTCLGCIAICSYPCMAKCFTFGCSTCRTSLGSCTCCFCPCMTKCCNSLLCNENIATS